MLSYPLSKEGAQEQEDKPGAVSMLVVSPNPSTRVALMTSLSPHPVPNTVTLGIASHTGF